MTDLDGWEPLETFDDLGAAEVLCAQLLRGEVPAQVLPGALKDGPTSRYVVFVSKKLAHRARWLLAQLPPSDGELEFLATGKLPGTNDKDDEV